MARRFHRVRHHTGRALSGGKGSLLTAGAGAATGLASQYLVGAVPFLGASWWAMPTALALVGHFLKRKNPAIGGGLLGVAGYWAYNAYAQRGAVVATAKGLEDAGAFGGVSYNDNIGTDAAPALGTAQAAALVVPKRPGAMGFIDAGYSDFSDAGDVVDAYGLQD